MNTQVNPKFSKAAAFLGIDKGISAMATVTVQIQGMILLKENSGKARRRFCVVKDGFFIWYDKTPAESRENRLSFDKKPMGLFPLNMALVQLKESKTEIFLRHNEIPKSELTIIPDSLDVNEWLEKLKEGTGSTWEQAQLGMADLESLKAKGTKLEAEKEEAVKEWQAKIRELEIANKKKNELIERDRLQNENFQKQYGQAVAQLESKETKLKELKEKFAAEDKEMKQLHEKNQLLEKKLHQAHLALQKLDVDLQEYFGHSLSKKRATKPQSQMASLGASTISDSAAIALKKAMVQSSPDVRHHKKAPVVSDMNLPRVEAKVTELTPPKLGQTKNTVSREAVAASVRAIKVFIDHHRGTSNSDDDSQV